MSDLKLIIIESHFVVIRAGLSLIMKLILRSAASRCSLIKCDYHLSLIPLLIYPVSLALGGIFPGPLHFCVPRKNCGVSFCSTCCQIDEVVFSQVAVI